jgi:hypothetical protein
MSVTGRVERQRIERKGRLPWQRSDLMAEGRTIVLLHRLDFMRARRNPVAAVARSPKHVSRRSVSDGDPTHLRVRPISGEAKISTSCTSAAGTWSGRTAITSIFDSSATMYPVEHLTASYRWQTPHKRYQAIRSMAGGNPLGSCCYQIRNSSFADDRIALRQKLDDSLQVFFRFLI